ncbi:MAG: efflux RND transporter periplasmic adaptor subunit [Deltaproteobacteria bacterium]|nr:efflux RND transporter periplasmic adaptor subunit [Deltaproteobacteria bacterium]MCL5276231.1 efflux RND transporter periplasmic adaptor subunit [Deltaproteobacteria bacterium]
MKRYFIILGITFVALTAYGCSKHTPQGNAANGQIRQNKEKCKTMYKSTMMPKEVSSTPGKDSMGMEMVPFQVCEQTGQEKSLAPGTVQISSRLQQMYGVTLGTVKNRKLAFSVRNDAIIRYDETRLKDINVRFSGYIQKLYADYTGMMVYKGQPLFTIYSPELLSAEQEYLLVVNNPYSANNRELVYAAEQKLRLWNITGRQIQDIKKAGRAYDTLSFYAPFTGYIIEKNVVQGQHVDAGQTLFRIADLSDVWAMVDIYESQIPFVRTGQQVSLQLLSFPGKDIKGTIDYIYPYLDNGTRTVKARVVVPNPGYSIKPDMYGSAVIRDDIGEKLAVPADAVMNTGTRQVVFVDRGDGYFEPHTVKLGEHVDRYYVVISGLESGDRVVTNPVFLIDAESNLNEASGALGSMPGMNMGNPKEIKDSKLKIQDSQTSEKKPLNQETSPAEKQNSMPGMKM